MKFDVLSALNLCGRELGELFGSHTVYRCTEYPNLPVNVNHATSKIELRFDVYVYNR